MLLSKPKGSLEIITGPMFSGKTEELLKRIKVLKIAEIKTLIIKPAFDTRFSKTELVSRNGAKMEAFNVEKPEEILKLWDPSYEVVAIDEINFFNEEVIEVIKHLLLKNVKVICSGLDMDFMCRPFGIVPHLLAIADEVTKLKAVCMLCKQEAGFSYRKTNEQEVNVLGDSLYEARCRICHNKGQKKKEQ